VRHNVKNLTIGWLPGLRFEGDTILPA